MVEEQSAQPLATVEQAPLAASAARLNAALERARSGEGDARLKLAGELNVLLRRQVAVEEREPVAHFVIEKLDDEAFHDLYDAEGASCRATAVEAVLALGFPFALHLWPEDLEYLRATKPIESGSPTLRAMAIVTGVLAALFALAFFIHV
jgi:hypothetical protein